MAKFNSQVAAISNTGLNTSAPLVSQQKSKEPNVASPVHNRGLTIGGKRSLSGGGKLSGSQIAAIKSQQAPKAPHPAVAKNQGSSPSVKWG